jgi:hypothetical protein
MLLDVMGSAIGLHADMGLARGECRVDLDGVAEPRSGPGFIPLGCAPWWWWWWWDEAKLRGMGLGREE